MRFSLTSFPQAFLPLIVVVGDRREVRPKSSGDLLAYSASTLDLLYLAKLQLPPDTLILSDKVFIIERPEIIRQLCSEVNILTIGSPAVNLFSRRINDFSLFRFEIETGSKELMQRQYAIMDKYKLDLTALSIYKAILEQDARSLEDVSKHAFRDHWVNKDDKGKRLLSEIFEQVKTSGLKSYRELLRKHEGDALLAPVKSGKLDLSGPERHGKYIQHFNDFGLVSLAKHPFAEADDKVVVYVAGKHGPATAHGVKLLAQAENWEGRELGGIFEVHINTNAAFSQRVQDAGWSWDISTYDAGRFSLEVLGNAAEKMQVFLSTPLRWNAEEKKESVMWLAQTISDILSRQFGDGHCRHPYEPDQVGNWSFIDGIMKYFPESRTVIHNLTGLSPGVMFEVGCSMGFRKKPILIWDTSVTPFSSEKLPRLLRHAPIVPINLATHVTAANTLADVIPKAIGQAENYEETPGEAMPDERQVFLFVTKKNPELRRIFIQKIKDMDLIPKTEEDINARTSLEKIHEAIATCRYVIVDGTRGDPDGMIVLGLARTKERRVMELNEVGSKGCSMFDGLKRQWHSDSLEKDVEDSIRMLIQG
jgi:hypothetical protein